MIHEVSKAIKPLKKRRNLVITITAIHILVGLIPPYLMGLLIDELYPTFDFNRTQIFMFSTLLVVLLVVFILDWLHGYMKEELVNRGAGVARSVFFWHVLHKDYKFFLTHPVGDISNKVIHDVATYVKTKLMMIPSFILNIIHIVILLGFLLFINLYMTFIVVGLGIFFILVYAAINTKLRYYSTKEREDFSDLMSDANTTLTGIDTIQLYAGEEYAAEYFEKLVEEYEEDLIKLKFWQSLSKATINTVTTIVPLIAIIVGVIYILLGGEISISEVIKYYYFLPRLKEPVKSLADFNIDVQNAKAVELRIKELLPDVIDESIELEQVDHIETIEFIDLGFRYQDGPPILRDLNLKLKRGDSLAITGPSGVGKTTLLRLLKKQITPTNGILAVNGRDYTEIEGNSYISRIAVVPQNVFIFNDSLSRNISFGKDYSEKHIRDAAKLSAIDHFSMDEIATGMSGGERQRLGLARALACVYDVLILDEPTAELDYETEMQIIKNLKRVQKETNCIMIVVTHSENILENLCAKKLVLRKN